MKKDSEQVQYKVIASLPYPLWLVGSLYSIVGKLGEAELSFETVRQTAYDARLRIQDGEFDFKTDRQGWASYTRVLCDITTEHSVNPLTCRGLTAWGIGPLCLFFFDNLIPDHVNVILVRYLYSRPCMSKGRTKTFSKAFALVY